MLISAPNFVPFPVYYSLYCYYHSLLGVLVVHERSFLIPGMKDKQLNVMPTVTVYSRWPFLVA